MARLREMFHYMTQAIPWIDEPNRVLLRCDFPWCSLVVVGSGGCRGGSLGVCAFVSCGGGSSCVRACPHTRRWANGPTQPNTTATIS